jgi:iron complex transport system permease protein
MQGLFRNPLADPGLIGVSAGAAAGAVLALVARWVFAPVLGLVPEPLLVPVAAFAGGLFATWLVYTIATRDGRTSVATMLLAGIAVNAAAGALIGLMTYAADEAELRSLTMWTLGSVSAADWSVAIGCLGVSAVAAAIFIRRHRAFDAFLLGESEAHALGIDTQRFQRWTVALTAVVVGVCVSFSGLIAFVGLVAPHIVRLWAGPSHRVVLPGAALLGGVLLLGADTLARTVVSPAELPIGIVTSLLGAPFFIALLLRRRGGFG